MAAAAGGQSDEATCYICQNYFKDPVTIPECGHNFCRSCLIQCWGESEAEASCPQCGERVQRRSLISNRQFANLVELVKNLSLQEGKKEGGEGGVCKDHQKPLERFCKEDEALICLVCDRSNEHKHHEVIPLEEAFREYKGKICSRLEILTKERKEILAYQAVLDKESKDLLKLTETERLKTVEKFKELRQFLEEQEKRLLNHAEEVEKEIEGRRDEQLARLSRKLSALDEIIQQMEKKRQQPASELLQDVRSTLQRYEKRESPGKSLVFPPELRNRILEYCDLVDDAMKQLKDALLFRKAYVTLDPDTAHPKLILSADSEVPDIDPIVGGGGGGGSDIVEEEGSAPMAAVGAAGVTVEKVQSDDESDRGSDHSGLKRKPLAMKMPVAKRPRKSSSDLDQATPSPSEEEENSESSSESEKYSDQDFTPEKKPPPRAPRRVSAGGWKKKKIESGSDSDAKADSEEEEEEDDDDRENAKAPTPKSDSDSNSDESVKKPSRGRKPAAEKPPPKPRGRKPKAEKLPSSSSSDSDSDSDVDRISEWKRRDEERRRELEEKRKREQEEELRRLREQEREEKERKKEKAEKGEVEHSDSDSSVDDEVPKKSKKGRPKAPSSSDSEVQELGGFHWIPAQTAP